MCVGGGVGGVWGGYMLQGCHLVWDGMERGCRVFVGEGGG
jgi:hypothetical protein